jgi:hypothetical protein
LNQAPTPNGFSVSSGPICERISLAAIEPVSEGKVNVTWLAGTFGLFSKQWRAVTTTRALIAVAEHVVLLFGSFGFGIVICPTAASGPVEF